MFSCFHIYSFHVLIYYGIAAGNIHHKHTQAPSVALGRSVDFQSETRGGGAVAERPCRVGLGWGVGPL